MLNFEYCNPTRLVFGKGEIAKLPQLIPEGFKNILVLYGGGSIKKNGVYQQAGSSETPAEAIVQDDRRSDRGQTGTMAMDQVTRGASAVSVRRCGHWHGSRSRRRARMRRTSRRHGVRPIGVTVQ